MAKEAITITVDGHIHQWIKEKGGNKSKVVNTLLHSLWVKDCISTPRTEKRIYKSVHEQTQYKLRPPHPSSNGVHYLINVDEDRVQDYLDRGFTLHDSKHLLQEQLNLVWELNGTDVDLHGFPIGVEEE
jgi:predicted transcriptional regulator